MNILIVGGGGREHAIAECVLKGEISAKLFAAPGNAGIAQIARCVDADPCDGAALARICALYKIDFCIVSPDAALAAGAAEILRGAGISAFGPDKAAAEIESSKVFAKRLMQKYNIPTARSEVFTDVHAALSYLESASFPIVIKADGLALGKGVIIAESKAEAADACRKIMEEKIFGDSGNSVLIEEFLRGEEVSVLAFTDSKTLSVMPTSMDHKRAEDGDAGLNTGGMGAVSPNPFWTTEIARRSEKEIFLPTIDAMNKEGRPFKGCLYFGLMLTEAGPKVIEYNCRFGDPEAQTILPLLETSLIDIMRAVEEARLSSIEIKWKEAAACTVMLCSKGYPLSFERGFPISGLEGINADGVNVFHSGTALEDGRLVSAGGRVLGITATAPILRDAVDEAYRAARKIRFENMYYRQDIGRWALGARA